MTGDSPIVSIEPSYDLVGLEADEEFQLSYGDAVALSRRLSADLAPLAADVELES